MMRNYPHVVLLRGKYPFTSIQFVMRKKTYTSVKKKVMFNGLPQTENYLQNRLQKYSELLDNSVISFNPFSSLPEGVSHYFLDHSDFFSGNGKDDNSDTLFHTDYFWLDSGERVFKVKFDIADVEVGSENIIQLRIHSYATLSSKNVECVFEKDLDLKVIRDIEEFITLNISVDNCFAIVGKMKSGNCTIKNLSLKSWKLKNQNISEIKSHNVQQSESVV